MNLLTNLLINSLTDPVTNPAKNLVKRTLVAGVGNVFFGDDGFGSEVARRLAARSLPEGVSVTDFGIRGVHLAFELSSGYDDAIVIDAVARGGEPGTLYVIAPELGGLSGLGQGGAAVAPDAHGINLDAVFAMTLTLGAAPGRVRVIGCEAKEVVDRIGLSAPVEGAVERAIALLITMLADGARPGAVEEVGR